MFLVPLSITSWLFICLQLPTLCYYMYTVYIYWIYEPLTFPDNTSYKNLCDMLSIQHEWSIFTVYSIYSPLCIYFSIFLYIYIYNNLNILYSLIPYDLSDLIYSINSRPIYMHIIYLP